MKTLILNGSPRKNGDTKTVINRLTTLLEGEVKIVDAYYCNIAPCIDCRYCFENEGCCVEDEWQSVHEYLKTCDNVIIASPNYFSELSGQLLAVTSRLQNYFCAKFFRNVEPDLKKKLGGIIIVGGGDGGMATPIRTAKILLNHMNAKTTFKPICFHDTNNKPAIEDVSVLKMVDELAEFLNQNSEDIT